MTIRTYMEALLKAYGASYDLTVPYSYEGLSFTAYGFFYAHQEKYVLSREAQMWESNGFDHAFFLEADRLTPELFKSVCQMVQTHAEPELVRGGKKLPVKNHMYSDITIVFVSRERIPDGLLRQIRRYRFSRNYLFTIRGWCDARAVAVDLAENRVYGNAKAKPLLKFYRKLLTE